MIVKDEELTIADTLKSVIDYADRFILVDTGSCDDTLSKIATTLQNFTGVVDLIEIEFLDFSQARNDALAFARQYGPLQSPEKLMKRYNLSFHPHWSTKKLKTDYLLLLDADDVVKNAKLLVKQLYRLRYHQRTSGLIKIQFGDNFFDSLRVINTHSEWKFQGKVHEVLVHPQFSYPPSEARLTNVTILHNPSQTSQEKSEKRWIRDIKLLQEALVEDATDSRSAFYLGQTLYWLTWINIDKWENLAIQALNRRIDMQGWKEEVYHCHMCLGDLYTRLNKSSLENYILAHLIFPHRAEPLERLSKHFIASPFLSFVFAVQASRLPLPKYDILWIENDVYSWKIADLIALSAWNVSPLSNRFLEEGFKASCKAARLGPKDETRLQENLESYQLRLPNLNC